MIDDGVYKCNDRKLQSIDLHGGNSTYRWITPDEAKAMPVTGGVAEATKR